VRLSKKFAAIAITASVALTATAAFAYWTTSGSGSGSSSSGTSSTITVHQTADLGTLTPGTSKALSGNFDNSGVPATISGVTAIVSTFSSQGNLAKPACTQNDFAISGTASGSVVPNGTGVGSWSGLSLDMVNGAGNQDNCKSISVPVAYTAAS